MPRGEASTIRSRWPLSPTVPRKPGRPLMWSPWKWVMQMALRLLILTPALSTCSCVPSPQSKSTESAPNCR